MMRYETVHPELCFTVAFYQDGSGTIDHEEV
jgi:hypothetical protein